MHTDIKEQINRALQFQKEEKFFEAECIFHNILETNPNNADIYNLLGNVKRKQKRFKHAEEYIQKAIDIESKADYYINLGKIYADRKKYCEAIDHLKKAISLDFNNAQAWFNLGRTLNKNQQPDDAIIAFHKAIMIQNDFADAYRFVGNIYYTTKNDPAKAAEYYEEVIKYDPENVKAKGALGAAYLKNKEYKKGWEYFEFRPNKRIVTSIRAMLPGSKIELRKLWNGEDLTDKTLYVYYEGGFGDTIMFSRYLPFLKKKCKKVLFRPQIDEVSLFQDNNLDVEILNPTQSEDGLDFDYHTPIMSLPRLVHLDTEEDIPFKEGYIKSNPEIFNFYKEKYFNNDKFKIGIKWQGNTIYDKTRCITLKSFFKLFELENTKFYSLQKGSGFEQLQQAENYEIEDLGSTFKDFSDTAAAIDNLDLIICNDTSVAHVAGALGKRCWILLPFAQDWRWSTDLSYCLWYNSVRLFKQKKPKNWLDVFDSVYLELKKII